MSWSRRSVVLLGAAAAVRSAGAAAADRPVVVASKIDAEGALLGSLIALGLERAGIPVERRLQLGPTRVVRAALVAGEVDIYPEYTGNGAIFHDRVGDPAWTSAQSALDLARRLDADRFGLVWLSAAPANNTWLIALRGDLARANALSSMDDLARFLAGGGRVKLAASAEFVESPAALPSFERAYGFALPRRDIVILPGGDTAVLMRAAAEAMSGVNAAMVYGTDGALAVLDLVALTDPRHAQVVYEPAPVARRAVLERFPAIEPALDRIYARLSLMQLRSLNAAIVVEGRPPREVARSYLDRLTE